MSLQSEQIQPIPPDVRLRNAFYESARDATLHLTDTHGLEVEHRLAPLIVGFVNYGVITRPTTKLYSQDIETAGRNAMKRPFGIELDTLSPNIQLVLYPQMIFKPTEEDIKAAKEEGLVMRTEEGQAMIYVLDGFEKETGDIENMAANLYFVGHMTNALLEGRYPLNIGEKSPQFKQELKQALNLVQEYAGKLPKDRKQKLSRKISRIVSLDDAKLDDEARRLALYHAEPMKMPGLYEFEETDIPKETPEEAVQNVTLYLHLDERDLPQVLRDGVGQIPSLPWVEYGKNRWNRSHQLFGRYETSTDDGSLRVDYRLDSTHFPSKYGFFDTIEIIRDTEVGIGGHIILGQEVNSEMEPLAGAAMLSQPDRSLSSIYEELPGLVYPIVLAGDFDFTQADAREFLGKLAADKRTKPDVGRVVADVLRLSAESRLQRFEHVEKENKQ